MDYENIIEINYMKLSIFEYMKCLFICTPIDRVYSRTYIHSYAVTWRCNIRFYEYDDLYYDNVNADIDTLLFHDIFNTSMHRER